MGKRGALGNVMTGMLRFLLSKTGITSRLAAWREREAVKFVDERNIREFKRQKPKRLNERPLEYAFVFSKLAALAPATILDVGTGLTALPALMRTCGGIVTAIDNVRDYWPAGMVNRHFHVIDSDITKNGIERQFAFITCVSVLEHIREHRVAMRNMFRLLEPGGHLVVTCPYNERQYAPNVYDIEGSAYGQNAPYITQAFSRRNVNSWLEEGGVELVEQEFWCMWSGGFWTVGEQILPPRRVARDDKHHLSCMLFRKSIEGLNETGAE